MRAPQEPRTSDSVTTLPIPTLLRETRKFMIGGRAKARDWVFSNPQKLFLNIRQTVVRTAGILMTSSGLRSLGVSLGVLVTL